MKKKTIRQIVGLVLALVMLSAFTGCSKSSPETSNPKPKESAKKGTDAKDNEKEKEPLKFSYMSSIWGVHPQDGTPIFDELMKRTNTEIDFRWYPTDQYEEKVTVTLGSDDMPDVLAGGGTAKLVDEGAIIPLDDLLESHGKNILAQLTDEDYPYMRSAMDGHIYTVPFILDFPPAYAMQIRKDWLDNVGMEKTPETWDEWKTVWKAFQDQDANKDGDATNEIPYAGDVYGLLPAFGINVSNKIGFTVDSGGKYTLMYEMPEFRTFLEEMQSMYKEGLLDKEFATRGTYVDNPELEKVLSANLVGSAMTWAANTRTSTEVMREVDPKAAMIGVPPIKGPDGKQGIPSRGFI